MAPEAAKAAFRQFAKDCREGGYGMFLFLLGLLTGFVEQQFNKPRMRLCVAVAAEDVRHLKSLAHSRRSIGRDHPEREAIERARRAGDQICTTCV